MVLVTSVNWPSNHPSDQEIKRGTVETRGEGHNHLTAPIGVFD